MNVRKLVALTALLLILSASMPQIIADAGGRDAPSDTEGGKSCVSAGRLVKWAVIGAVVGILTGGIGLLVVGALAVADTVACALGWGGILDIIWNKILDAIGQAFQALIKGILWLFQWALNVRPDWSAYDPIIAVMLKLLIPLLFVQLLIVAAYLIFCSIDPGQRSKAKSMLNKLITAVLLISVSNKIYILLFEIARGMTNTIFDKMYDLLGGSTTATSGLGLVGIVLTGVIVSLVVAIIAGTAGFGLTLLGWIAAFALLVVLLLMVRYAMVILFYIIFPVTLFLYFFDYTRSLGGDLLMKTVMWLFMGPVFALILAITTLSLLNLASSDPTGIHDLSEKYAGYGADTSTAVDPGDNVALDRQMDVSFSQALIGKVVAIFMLLGGFVALVAVPLMMTQLMKWVGGAVAAAGMMGLVRGGPVVNKWKNFSMVALGGAMMGQGSRGIVSAATQAAWMNRESIESGEGLFGSTWRAIKGGGSSSASYAGDTGGGFFRNLSSVFRSPERENARYWAETDNQGRFPGTPHVGAKGGTVSGSASGGGLLRKPDRETTGGSMEPPATSLALHQQGFAPDDEKKLISAEETRYGSKGPEGETDIKGVYAGVIPEVDVFGRTDSIFTGVGSIREGIGIMFKKGTGMGVGQRAWKGTKTAGMGLFKILWAFRPISPFLPVRMAGTWLTAISPSHLPPVMQPYANWMGEKMRGLGFRQMFYRTHWSDHMRHYLRKYDKAKKKGDEEGVEKAKEKIFEILDQSGYKGTELEGKAGRDLPFHFKLKSKLREKHSDLYREYLTRRGAVEKGYEMKDVKAVWDQNADKLAAGELPHENEDFMKAANRAMEQAGLTEDDLADADNMRKFKAHLLTVAWLSKSGVKTKEDQESLLEEMGVGRNGTLYDVDKEGKVSRRRFFKLHGRLAQAADKMEEYVHTHHLRMLLNNGVPYSQAIEMARDQNLILERDKSGGVYIDMLQLEYLLAQTNKEGAWAKRAADAQAIRLDAPVTINYRDFPPEAYQKKDNRHVATLPGAEAEEKSVEVDRFMVVSLTRDQMDGKEKVMVGGQEVSREDIAGGNFWVIEDDKIIVARTTDGRWMHFGEMVWEDEMLAATRSLAATDLNNRDDMVNLAMGMSYSKLKGMGREDKASFVSAQDPSQSYTDLLNLGDEELQHKFDEAYQAKKKDFMASHAFDEEKIKSQTVESLRERLRGIGDQKNAALAYEDLRRQMDEADRAVFMSKQEMEMLRQRGFTDADIMLLKMRTVEELQRFRDEYGIDVELGGVNVYDQSEDMNPMMMSKVDGKLYLNVNAAHGHNRLRELSAVEKETLVEEERPALVDRGVAEFLDRAGKHFATHEISQAWAEDNLAEVTEAAEERLKAEGMGEKTIRRLKRKYDMAEAAEETVADSFVKARGDDARESMRRLWEEEYLPYLERVDYVDEKNKLNAARIVALTEGDAEAGSLRDSLTILARGKRDRARTDFEDMVKYYLAVAEASKQKIQAMGGENA